MATVTAKLTLESKDINNQILNNKLEMSLSDTLSISKGVELKRIACTTTAQAVVSASAYTKSWVFVQNTDSNIVIKLVKSEGGDEFMDLGAGEWAFFPWSTAIDLMADAASGTPILEVAILEV